MSREAALKAWATMRARGYRRPRPTRKVATWRQTRSPAVIKRTWATIRKLRKKSNAPVSKHTPAGNYTAGWRRATSRLVRQTFKPSLAKDKAAARKLQATIDKMGRRHRRR